jgi:hypothetical protein
VTTEARDDGRMEAESFDLRLRALESREREDRLTRLVADGPGAGVPVATDTSSAAIERLQEEIRLLRQSLLAATAEPAESVVIERLQRQLTVLADFQSALGRSKAWRVLQALRRPFGRAW